MWRCRYPQLCGKCMNGCCSIRLTMLNGHAGSLLFDSRCRRIPSRHRRLRCGVPSRRYTAAYFPPQVLCETSPNGPSCLVQADDLQFDKAVVPGKTGRTARHLWCQSAEVKVVGVGTNRIAAPI